MPKVRDVLNVMRFNKTYGLENGGSCFGVTDPSRLRPEFVGPLPKTIPVCPSCKNGLHECTEKATVYSIEMKQTTEHGDSRMVPEVTKSEVPCQCRQCNSQAAKT